MNTEFFPIHITVIIFILIGTTASALWSLWAAGINQAVRDSGRAFRYKALLALALAAWFAVGLLAVSNGLLAAGRADLGPPNLIWAVFLPVAAGLATLLHPAWRSAVLSIPVSHLTGFHLLRVMFGIVFLALLELQGPPAAFALRGGYGDILGGLLGLLAAALYWSRGDRWTSRSALLVFSAVGLLDFAVVFYTGLTTIVPDSAFAQYWPFLLIPVLAVPQFAFTHLLALRALAPRRVGGWADGAQPA